MSLLYRLIIIIILLATSSQTYLLNLRAALPRILGVVTLKKYTTLASSRGFAEST